jgi:ADP-ribose pyrophosphatase YjhB (NUDIX family)
MKLLDTLIHSGISSMEGNVVKRVAARGIILDGEEILLLYTKRYNDFSLPGGGLNEGEDPLLGLRRELSEETGARNVKVLSHYGLFDEYRPHHKPGADVLYMRSHFFVCSAERELGRPVMEAYEEANGMTPRWMNIHKAIEHNDRVIHGKHASMGLSVQRETYMLKHIARDLVGAGGSNQDST